MNFNGNFNYIGNVDTSIIRARMLELPVEQWGADTFRQKRYEAHRDTQTIGLVFDPDFRHSHPTRLPQLQLFEEGLRPVLGLVADYYEKSSAGQNHVREFGVGYFIRATLVKLQAGGRILQHQDNNFSLAHSHRVHVPIITNPDVQFEVGAETVNMRQGEVIEINNRRIHAVHNAGNDDRIHLILDFVLPAEKCCCGRKHHPHTHCSPQACMETDQLRIPCTCFLETAVSS
jgi:hypothetical protein